MINQSFSFKLSASGTDSYDAYNKGINIEFENEIEIISCNYDFTITDGSLSEICSGQSGEYYTHSAFTSVIQRYTEVIMLK